MIPFCSGLASYLIVRDLKVSCGSICTVTYVLAKVVKNKKDVANFSARKEDMPRQIEYKDSAKTMVIVHALPGSAHAFSEGNGTCLGVALRDFQFYYENA